MPTSAGENEVKCLQVLFCWDGDVGAGLGLGFVAVVTSALLLSEHLLPVLTVRTEWPEQSPPSAEGLPFGLCLRGIAFHGFASCHRLFSLAAGCLLGHCRSWGECGELPLAPLSEGVPSQRSCLPSYVSHSACVFGCFCAREFPSRPPRQEDFTVWTQGGFCLPAQQSPCVLVLLFSTEELVCVCLCVCARACVCVCVHACAVAVPTERLFSLLSSIHLSLKVFKV